MSGKTSTPSGDRVPAQQLPLLSVAEANVAQANATEATVGEATVVEETVAGPTVAEANVARNVPGPQGAGGLFLDKNLVLAAGAGSGKTHALVTVALGLYVGAGGRAPIEPTRVWAVTFTEKAAAELRQRVADRALRLARRGGDLGDEPELATMLGGRIPGASEWEQIARSLSAAPIGTFHSLCGQLLRNFAAEARLDPRFKVLDEKESRAIFEDARESVLLEELEAGRRVHGLVAELGDLSALRKALEFLDGKLAEEGRDPSSLLEHEAFDTEKARGSFERACGSMRPLLDEVARTTHVRLEGVRTALARESVRIGDCPPDDVDGWYPAVAAVMGTSAGRGALPKEVKPLWDMAKAAWVAIQERLASCRQAEIGRDLVAVLARVSEAYATEKRRLGALDFSDLIRHTRDLLRDDLEVRREAKKRVQALLVDEFQDTNGLQLELVQLLAEARDREREVLGDGGGTPETRPAPLDGSSKAVSDVSDFPLEPALFCAVGDRKQSIYEFRGADVSLFARLTTKAREGRENFRLHALTRSWRSRPGLVRFANDVFQELLAPKNHDFEVGWFPGEDDLHPQRQDPERYASVPAVQLLAGDPELDAGSRRPFEAGLVAHHITALLSSNEGVMEKDGTIRPLVGADVAILLRAFTHLPLYQQALAERGIPSLVVKGRRFHRAREIRDLTSLLRALADPGDRLASAGVLRAPWVGLSDDSLLLLHQQGGYALSRFVKGCAAELPPGEAEKVHWISELVFRLGREVDRLGPAVVLRMAMEEVGFLPMLAASFGGEQRLANVEKLLSLLDSRQGISTFAMAEELLAASLDDDDREPPADVAAGADPRAVRIMTVHASKGLEFPVVVLPELGAGDPPANDAVLFDRNLGLAIKPTDALRKRLADSHAQEVVEVLKARSEAESRRLLYVAITRARDRLVLCGERGSRGGGGTWRGMLDSVWGSIENSVQVVPPPSSIAASSPRSGPLVATPGDPAAGVGGFQSPVRHFGHEGTAGAILDAATFLGDPEGSTLPSDPSSRRLPGDGLTGPGAFGAPVGPDDHPSGGHTAPQSVADLLRKVAPPEIRPAAFVAAVTELSNLSHCERRYFYRTVAGLEEHGAGDPFDSLFEADEVSGLDRLARGVLAHRLLECVDLQWMSGEPTAALVDVLQREGLGPDQPEILAIRKDVEAFFAGPLGRQLLSTPPERIFRELPFGLEVESRQGVRLAIRGQIDLLFVDDEGRLNLVDYKHALPSKESSDSYAFQVHTYALAAWRIIPDARGLQAGIAWLRDRKAEIELRPIERNTVLGHEEILASLADKLANARRQRRWSRLEDPTDCGGCGFRFRCWGADAGMSGGRS